MATSSEGSLGDRTKGLFGFWGIATHYAGAGLGGLRERRDHAHTTTPNPSSVLALSVNWVELFA